MSSVNPDDFFVELGNTKPFVKMAFEGFAGCGKTYTMALLAAGIHRHIGSTKPIVIFDTERAAKFLVAFFAEQKIRVLVKESRSLADLAMAFTLCAEGASDVLVIDSITHVWEDFLAAYLAKVHRTRLEFSDWGIIKPTWKREFATPFVNGPFHCLMSGRAGYEYVNEVNQETGKREIYKSGIKMRVEGETAYEPDILVLMDRFEQVLGDEKAVWREATVLKDRSTLIDGRTFKNPTFDHFRPAIERILLAPAARVSPPAEADAAALLRTEEDKRAWTRERDVALEEIEGYLTSIWPGQGAAEKKAKTDAVFGAFATRSWTAVTQLRPDQLRAGLERLRAHVAATTAEKAPPAAPRQPAKASIQKTTAVAAKPAAGSLDVYPCAECGSDYPVARLVTVNGRRLCTDCEYQRQQAGPAPVAPTPSREPGADDDNDF